MQGPKWLPGNDGNLDSAESIPCSMVRGYLKRDCPGKAPGKYS